MIKNKFPIRVQEGYESYLVSISIRTIKDPAVSVDILNRVREKQKTLPYYMLDLNYILPSNTIFPLKKFPSRGCIMAVATKLGELDEETLKPCIYKETELYGKGPYWNYMLGIKDYCEYD